jgi:squalene synthase HpnC
VPVAHYENFPVASWLVPATVRPSIVAIYHFARGADDIADEGDEPPAARLERLDHYERMLARIEEGNAPAEPPFAALAIAIRRDRLPLKLFRDLLSAFRQDVLKTRYADFADVLDYCSRSANPVGRLLLHLYGVSGEAQLGQSDAVCTGLQLTNFWQDVSLDWDKGRIYLPLAEMSTYKVTEQDIAMQRCDERWRALITFQVERTFRMLEGGRPLARALPLRAGIELKMVIAGGQRILRAISAAQCDVFRRRPTLAKRDFAAMFLSALVR